MEYQGNPGTNALANVLSGRMKRESASPLPIDFGEICSDYSLRTNTFPLPIPKSDYTVCRHAGGLLFGAEGGGHAGHSPDTGEHLHSIKVPIIKPGDRVLVAWVQNEAVVVDAIMPGSSVEEV